MKTTTRDFNLKVAALIAATSFAALSVSNNLALGAVILSDELQILSPSTVGGPPIPIFDSIIPETGPAAPEGEAVFGPLGVVPIPLPLPPGSLAVILTEPAGEPLEPGETPIFFSGPNGRVLVSDVVISTVNNQAGIAPMIALVSDGDPFLQQLVATLPPTTPFIPETGALQDLTLPLVPGGIFPGIGPVTVLVRSDVTTPEPSTIALIALGCVSLAASAWRKRRA